jgi:hypothetical protein
MIDDLVYAVYVTTAPSIDEATSDWAGTTHLLYAKNLKNRFLNHSSDVVEVELLNGQNHIVLLWAQHNDVWVDEQENEIDLTNITYPSVTLGLTAAECDKYAAFSAFKFIPATERTNTGTIELKRPFAQVNVATLDPAHYNVAITGTTLEVKGAGNAFNVAKQAASETVNVTYNWSGKVFLNDPLTVNNKNYDHYLAMGYVFTSGNVVVDYTIDAGRHGVIKNTINAVPVEKNYRTNIIGNLLTSDVKYNVLLDKKWGQPETNVEVKSVASAQELLEAIEGGSTESETNIKLEGDIDLGALFAASTQAVAKSGNAALPIVISEEKTMTLDLNGFTISTPWESETDGKHYYAFDNYGTLKIVDTKANGMIKARGIFNNGIMTLESGTIDACDGNGGYGVRNYVGAEFVMNGGSIVTSNEDDHQVDKGGYDATTLRVDEGATATINGGTINNICDYTFAIDNYGTVTVNGGEFNSVHSTVSTYGTMTINGGSFACNGIEGVTAHCLVAWDGTQTTINGGTFNGKDNYNGFNVDAVKGATVYIKGGEFLSVHSGSLYGDGSIIVTGGTFFDQIPAKYLAAGYS